MHTRARTHTRAPFQILRIWDQRFKKERLTNSPFRHCSSFLGEAPGPLQAQAPSCYILRATYEGLVASENKASAVAVGRPIGRGVATKRRQDNTGRHTSPPLSCALPCSGHGRRDV